jgi:HNH endonuclease
MSGVPRQPVSDLYMHATDRGCSAPGCDVPGYLCEVHHVEDWAQSGLTDIDNLTFACGPHHRLLGPGGWTTRKRADGRTEWIPHPTWIASRPIPTALSLRRRGLSPPSTSRRSGNRDTPSTR